MARPQASYDPLFPNAKDPRNTQLERTTADNNLIARAADANRVDEILQVLMTYLGTHPFNWAEGDDTVNDRIVRIGGTAACFGKGTICNYATPTTGIDPIGGGFVATTGEYFDGGWIGRNGIFGAPGIPGTAVLPPFAPIPPIIPQTGVAVPWPNPGGGNPGAGPRGLNPVIPQFPIGPDELPQLTNPWEWFAEFGLKYWDFVRRANAFRWATQSSENILVQPSVWDEILALFRELAGYIDGWPSSRTDPSDLNPGRASIFDVLFPVAGITRQLTHALGIEWYAGTISADGANIGFDTGTDLLNTGHENTDVTKIALIVSNLDDTSLRNTNVDAIETDPGGVDKVGQGLQTAGAYRLSLTSAVPSDNRPAGSDPASVMVGVYTERPQVSVAGDNTTWVVENLAGGPSFTPAFVPIDSDLNTEPVATVTVLTGGLATGTPLQFSAAALASGEWGISGSTITTFAADGISAIQFMGLASPGLTS
jgi:hypothetical protein